MRDQLVGVKVIRPVLINGIQWTSEAIGVLPPVADMLVHLGFGERISFFDVECADARQIADPENPSALLFVQESDLPSIAIVNARLVSLTDAVRRLEVELHDLTGKHEDKWAAEFREWMSGLKARADEKIQEMDESVSRIEEAAGVESNRLLAVRRNISTIETETSTVGGAVLADDYEKQARKHGVRAILWQLVVAVLLGGWALVIKVKIAFIGATEDGFSADKVLRFIENVDWPGLILLGAQNLPIVVALSYAVSQVVQNQASQRNFTRWRIELALIGPYVADLQDEEKARVKASFAERFFSPTVQMGSSKAP